MDYNKHHKIKQMIIYTVLVISANDSPWGYQMFKKITNSLFLETTVGDF